MERIAMNELISAVWTATRGRTARQGVLGDEVVDQQTLGPENASFSGGTNDSEHVNTLRNARYTHITTTEIL